MSKISNIILIFLSVITSIFLIEFTLFLILGKNPSNFNQTIYCYENFDYYYCPNSKYFNKNTKLDGLEEVIDYTNYQGIPIETPSNKKFNYLQKSNLYLIGDSYIQADEISINQRIASHLRKKKIKAVEIGMASWNSKQYKKVIDKISNKEDKFFFIFLMANDFFPNYTRSTLNNDLTFVKKENFTNELRYFFYKLKGFSWTVYLLNEFRYLENLSKDKKNSINNFTYSDFLNNFQCSNDLDNNHFKLDGFYDYLVFGQNYNCWPENHKKAVEKVLIDLFDIRDNIENNNGEVFYLFVPYGISFEEENTFNRKIPSNKTAHPIYLVDYIKNRLERNFIDLKPHLDKIKNTHSQKNSIYFQQDGHWKPIVHKKISELVINIINDKKLKHNTLN